MLSGRWSSRVGIKLRSASMIGVMLVYVFWRASRSDVISARRVRLLSVNVVCCCW